MAKRLILVFALIAIALGGSAGSEPYWAAAWCTHRKSRLLRKCRQADRMFSEEHGTRTDFDVAAPDGVKLRGWKVRPKDPNGDWVFCCTALRIIAAGISATRKCCFGTITAW